MDWWPSPNVSTSPKFGTYTMFLIKWHLTLQHWNKASGVLNISEFCEGKKVTEWTPISPKMGDQARHQWLPKVRKPPRPGSAQNLHPHLKEGVCQGRHSLPGHINLIQFGPCPRPETGQNLKFWEIESSAGFLYYRHITVADPFKLLNCHPWHLGMLSEGLAMSGSTWTFTIRLVCTG